VAAPVLDAPPVPPLDAAHREDDATLLHKRYESWINSNANRPQTSARAHAAPTPKLSIDFALFTMEIVGARRPYPFIQR
jgi:hypothetical protein